MRRLLVATILVSSLGVAACGAPKEGEVVRKKHEDARTYTTWVNVQTGQSCYSSGNPPRQTCTPTYTLMPFQQYDDEDWRIRLKNGDDEGWVNVDSETYKSLDKGDWFNREDGGVVKEQNKREPIRDRGPRPSN